MPQSIVLDGVSGFWKPFPVEYKRGKLKHEKSYEIQLCAQALCLEEMLKVRITFGAIFYGKSMRRRDVEFTEELRRKTEIAAGLMHDLIAYGRTPKPVYDKRCDSCSLFQLCLPKTIGKRSSVKRYLSAMVREYEKTS
jgi:CRISPR-associated exonuclease Cas4